MSTSVIVGASRGIGLALSKALLQRGGSVIACCRKPAQSDGLRALQDNFPDKIRTEEIDVTDQASTTALGKRVTASGSKIDLVFNVAGVLHDATVLLNDGSCSMFRSTDLGRTFRAVQGEGGDPFHFNSTDGQSHTECPLPCSSQAAAACVQSAALGACWS